MKVPGLQLKIALVRDKHIFSFTTEAIHGIVTIGFLWVRPAGGTIHGRGLFHAKV